jgi:hypothetical protein
MRRFVSLLTTAKLDAANFDVRRYVFRAVRIQSIKHSIRRARAHELDDVDTLADDDARSQLDMLNIREGIEHAAALIDLRCTPPSRPYCARAGRAQHRRDRRRTRAHHRNVRVIRHRALVKLRADFDQDPS